MAKVEARKARRVYATGTALYRRHPQGGWRPQPATGFEVSEMDHMTTPPDLTADSAVGDKRATQAPWLPLIVIVLAQLQMAINVSALPVSLGPLSEDLDAPATAAATALLLYSMFVAAFVMLGAKIGKLVGERRLLQVSVVVHGVAMALMATSTDASVMNIAQAIAGVSAAALVPTFVVLIAANYHGRQQATALGVLAGIPAVASGLTFVIAGFLATALSWRYSYGLIVVLAVVVFVLSFRLPPIPRQPSISIDLFGGRSLGCRDRVHPAWLQQPPDVGTAGGRGCGPVLAAAVVTCADFHPALCPDRPRPYAPGLGSGHPPVCGCHCSRGRSFGAPVRPLLAAQSWCRLVHPDRNRPRGRRHHHRQRLEHRHGHPRPASRRHQ